MTAGRAGLWFLLGVAAGCVGRPTAGGGESEGETEGGEATTTGEAEGTTSSTSATPDSETSPADTGTGEPAACTDFDVGPGTERHLDHQQYENTVRDLFDIAYAFPGVPVGHPFPGETLTVSEAQYEEAAVAVSELVAFDTLSPCAPDEAGAAAQVCFEDFVDDFGPRTFRHPLTDEERVTLLTVYADTQPQTLEEGLRPVLVTILTHPSFTGLPATGSPWPEDGAVIELDAHALATRLSYFIWNSTPDPTLLDAAASGALLEPGELRAQAERLLDDTRVDTMQGDFWEHLLSTTGVEQRTKHAEMSPPWTPELGAAMAAEQRAFVAHVTRDGNVADLFTATHTFVNGDLAGVYGADLDSSAPQGTALERVDLAAHRQGILTRLAFLTAHGGSGTAPIPSDRGVSVIDGLLCFALPPDPGGVDTIDPFPNPEEASHREVWDTIISTPSCLGCHELFDDIGWSLDNYDPLGRWVDEYGGFPVDAAGEAPAFEPTIEFDDAVGFINGMVGTPELMDCIPQRYFEFAVRRSISDEDACTLEALAAAFDATDGNFREALLAVVDTLAFRLARP